MAQQYTKPYTLQGGNIHKHCQTNVPGMIFDVERKQYLQKGCAQIGCALLFHMTVFVKKRKICQDCWPKKDIQNQKFQWLNIYLWVANYLGLKAN